MTDRPVHPETLMAQLNHYIDEATGGVTPPLQPSTTFARDDAYDLINPDHLYARTNPTLHGVAEDLLAKLEGGEEALLFASGMAAIAALVRTVPTGSTIVLQQGIYHGTTVWISKFCKRRQVNLVITDMLDTETAVNVITSNAPDLVIIETPSNPWIGIVDIRKIAASTHASGAQLAVDSTAATPVLSRPISFDADYVIHSATKTLNGHSDVLAGVLICARKDDRWAEIRLDRDQAGAMLGPFEVWLLLRGMRTLPLRVERTSRNALTMARFLEGHEKVHTVRYPGLQSNPGHSLAREQMPDGSGCLLSFQVIGGERSALAVTNSLKTIVRATSLGGVESVAEHRHTLEKAYDTGVPEDLIRLSIGIEHEDDLIADLDQALLNA